VHKAKSSIRLLGYDYSQQGGYYVTLVTQNRECLFGKIKDEEMILNVIGQIVREEWFRSAEIREEIRLFEDEFVVMPNHIHGIVWIIGDLVGATGRSPLQSGPKGPAPKSLASLIGGYKASVTKRINLLRNTPGQAVWQRNYYDHIIRNKEDANRIYSYIQFNLYMWQDDEENPARHP
jgi:putative transposase